VDEGVDEVAAEASVAEDPIAPLFAAAHEQFTSGATRASGSLLLFLTLLAFVFSIGSGATPTSVLILVVVLVVHELGHYLGMRAFGYRDVRMFFVPFLGAAVSGRRGNVAAWKDAVVLLLGPVPGVFLGMGALLASLRWPHPDLVQLGETLLLVNTFNLLPLGGLDGGKLLLRVIFARHRYLELGFAALGSLALIGLAFVLRAFALGLFAFFGLTALSRRARILDAASRLRTSLADAPATLDAGDARRLFDEARTALDAPLAGDARAISGAMEDILVATQRPPGFIASTLLFGVWAGTSFVALVIAVVLAHGLAPAEWERRTLAACTIELPDEPRALTETWDTPAGSRTVQLHTTMLAIVERFTVQEVDVGADVPESDRDAWYAAARARLASDLGRQSATFVSERATDVGGRPGIETVWSNGWRVWHARTLVDRSHVFVLVASSPHDTANASRFLDSFALAEAPAGPPE
jgi:hypothetical protein